jgi:hypothetical protein
MLNIKNLTGVFLVTIIVLSGCDQNEEINPQNGQQFATFDGGTSDAAARGVNTANGWYEEEEIYYLLLGVEEGVTERGENDLYLIGGDRRYQANVAEFIPGEPGYTGHWNVNVVFTEEGVTVADILASPYASAHYPEALFDDVEDILDAQNDGLVYIVHPGVVVLCPIISEQGAEAPGNMELPEDFDDWENTIDPE